MNSMVYVLCICYRKVLNGWYPLHSLLALRPEVYKAKPYM